MLVRDQEGERLRLRGIMDGYLAAFAKHDFRDVKFATNLKSTDNGVNIPVGLGLSRTVCSLKKGGQYFVDASQGQIEFWGVIDEMGKDTIFGVRLKVEGTLISEVERLGVRNTDPYYFPEVILSADEGMHEVVPERSRSSREDLIQFANDYFNAIEQTDGAIVNVRDDCQRLVNGAEDTVTDVSELSATDIHRGMSVQAQITEGYYAYIEGLRARRFPIVDVERGLVVAHLLFDHPGNIPKPSKDIPFGQPNSMIAFEVFKVIDREIHKVWAICYSTTYGSASGWM